MTITRLCNIDEPFEFGGKARGLSRAKKAGLPVPKGLAVSHKFVDAVAKDSARANRLRERLDEIPEPWVVRSSGVAEDSSAASFAGMHSTHVNVTGVRAVRTALQQIFESARSEAAMRYREQLGLDEPPRMGAVIQRMISADKSGVLFTENPTNGLNERIIEAAWGLGEVIVAGLVTPDHYRISPNGRVLERRPGHKDRKVIPAQKQGTSTVELPKSRRRQLCLDDSELEALNKLACQCEEHFEGEHDIEWSIRDGEVYLLQRRDITARLSP